MLTLLVKHCILLSCVFGAAFAADPKAGAKPPPTAEEVQAFEATKKAAESGDAAAQARLARMYVRGEGTLKNDAAALPWYLKCAERGDAGAQSMLGVFYTNARAVSRDYTKAMEWFHKAAAQNSSHAQYNLGYMYAVGKGTEKDFAESAKWYTKAAEQNEKNSQRILGGLYEAGRGVTKDLIAAHAWTTVSGTASTEAGAKTLKKIADQMTPEQLAAAKKLAGEITARVTKK